MLDTTVSGVGRLSLDDVSAADGSATTLVLSEKCISRTASLSMTFWKNPPGGIVANGTGAAPVFGIVGSNATKVLNSAAIGNNTNTPGKVTLSSSNHPGGAVVAFCDGLTGFLKDSLRQNVYGQLLSWANSRAFNLTTSFVSMIYRAWTPLAADRILSDGDFQETSRPPLWRTANLAPLAGRHAHEHGIVNTRIHQPDWAVAEGDVGSSWMISKERLIWVAPEVSGAGACLLRRRVDQRNAL